MLKIPILPSIFLQYICLTALIAVASAQYQTGYPAAGGYRSSGYKAAAGYKADYEGPSDYSFNYEVNDAATYDVKSQSEYSKDGYVAGSYSLIDADGLRRTVDYTADDYNGFQATVRREQVGYGQNYNGYSGNSGSYQAKPAYAPAYKPTTYSAGAYPSKTYGAAAYRPASYQASYPATYPATYPAVNPTKY
jgi:Insect cuticle protein